MDTDLKIRCLAKAVDINIDSLTIIAERQKELARAILAMDRNDTIINQREIKEIAGFQL